MKAKTILLVAIPILILSFHTCTKAENGSGNENGKLPTLTTTSITKITGISAVSGGNITLEGSSTVTSRGVCWSTGTSPTTLDSKSSDGAGVGTFVSNLSNLNGNTTYFVRAYATNATGSGYGMAFSFKTLGNVPTVATMDATNINATGAKLIGTIQNNLLSTVVTFEYGTTTSYGTSVTASPSPVTDTNKVAVTFNLTGLTVNTSYHYRIKAVNSAGISYGDDKVFTTTPTATDTDGNTYNTIKIGDQIWMQENLKTSKFNDNSSITLIADNTAWTNTTGAGFCFYNNDASTYKATYGALYNWYAVSSGKLCPLGYHMPTDAEWKQLELYLGMSQSDVDKEAWRASGGVGNKIREVGNAHWTNTWTLGTNSSGFTALPAGLRNQNGNFQDIGTSVRFWSSTPYINTAAPYDIIGGWARTTNGYDIVYRGGNLIHYGTSVRCLKD
jgi:uncharacterized protein (TIGR02145 family)